MNLVNTDIISTAPSGVDGINLSHILFVPQSKDPVASSGAVWFRPNDGQVERLVVQGANNVLEVRNAEGFGFYHSTVSQSIASSSIIIAGYSTIIQDDLFMNITGGNTIIVHIGGLYRLNYAVVFDNDAAGNSDGTVNSRILINGTKLTGSEMSAYIPIVGDGGFCSTVFHGMTILNRGDKIQIQAGQLQSISSLNIVSTTLNVELIRPRGALS